MICVQNGLDSSSEMLGSFDTLSHINLKKWVFSGIFDPRLTIWFLSTLSSSFSISCTRRIGITAGRLSGHVKTLGSLGLNSDGMATGMLRLGFPSFD